MEVQADLHDEPLSGLRIYLAACEGALEAGRHDDALDRCLEAVRDELRERGEL